MKIVIKKNFVLLMLLSSNSVIGQPIFNFTSTGNALADSGFAKAAANVGSFFSDNVTININVGFSSLGTNVLGQTQVQKAAIDYSLWHNTLSGDATSSADRTMIGSLPSGNSFSMLINGTANNPNGSGSSAYYLDNNNSINNKSVTVTRANAKALGLLNPNDLTADASISFSSNYAFDFNPLDGISAGKIDFVGIAMHEIFHSLGFSSGVDTLDYYTGSGLHAVAAGVKPPLFAA